MNLTPPLSGIMAFVRTDFPDPPSPFFVPPRPPLPPFLPRPGLLPVPYGLRRPSAQCAPRPADTPQSRGTMNWGDAFFYIQEACPGMEPGSVLEMLKGLERVRFNEANQVFEYIVSAIVASPFICPRMSLAELPLHSPQNVSPSPFQDP